MERRFDKVRSGFISEFQDLLPKIRSKQVEESTLTNVLQDYNESPYEKEKFLALLDARKKEIETAEFIIYHPDLPDNKFIDLDHTGDLAQCIIGMKLYKVFHSMATADLKKSEEFVTNTIVASKYIPRRTSISIN